MSRSSRTFTWGSLTLLFAMALQAAGARGALALESGPCTMEILLDGVPLPETFSRGTAYVEARSSREYEVRLRNRTGERIAVALSVDGLNSIDAKTTAAREGSKWVLGPYETLTIGGWQTSSETARRFVFTTERRSYGAWLGRTRNLGVIAAAVFREKRPVFVAPYVGRLGDDSGLPRQGRAGSARGDRAEGGADSSESGAAGERLEESRAPQDRDARSRPPEAPSSSGAAGNEESFRSADAEKGRKAARALSDELAATGIGRETDHRVARVTFDAEERPAAVLEIRYEYRDALVRLGVLPRPDPPCDDALARRERAHGFEDTGYAPDPYARGRR